MTIDLDQTSPATAVPNQYFGRRAKMLFLAYAVVGLGAALML